jgi:Rap1a immunity proteins
VKIKDLAVILSLFLPLPAWAQQDISSGKYMYSACKAVSEESSDGNAFAKGRCVGIIETILEFAEGLPDDFRFCIPEASTLGQAASIVVSYMDDYPESMDKNFKDLAATALHAAWPCP